MKVIFVFDALTKDKETAIQLWNIENLTKPIYTAIYQSQHERHLAAQRAQLLCQKFNWTIESFQTESPKITWNNRIESLI